MNNEMYKLGILAYGSLLKNTGHELEPHIMTRLPIETPFEIEYARSSRGRAGAPTLVPVPEGKGSKVNAQILLLNEKVLYEDAYNMLYRREINRIGAFHIIYNNQEQRKKGNGVIIEELKDYAGVSVVLYACLDVNIPEIINKNIPMEEKAKKLSHLAIESVNNETFRSKRDGIQYLADNISFGILTPLSDGYKDHILQETNASDLVEARLRVAEIKGIMEDS